MTKVRVCLIRGLLVCGHIAAQATSASGLQEGAGFPPPTLQFVDEKHHELDLTFLAEGCLTHGGSTQMVRPIGSGVGDIAFLEIEAMEAREKAWKLP